MEGQREDQNQVSLVSLDPMAEHDLLEILDYTRRTWGADQAEAYWHFLQDQMAAIAQESETLDRFSHQVDNLCMKICRWKKAKDGHRVFYERTDFGIHVLRVLHTSVNVADHFGSSFRTN